MKFVLLLWKEKPKQDATKIQVRGKLILSETVVVGNGIINEIKYVKGHNVQVYMSREQKTKSNAGHAHTSA